MEGCGHAQGLQSAAGCNSPREESRSDATEEEIGNAALASKQAQRVDRHARAQKPGWRPVGRFAGQARGMVRVVWWAREP